MAYRPGQHAAHRYPFIVPVGELASLVIAPVLGHFSDPRVKAVGGIQLLVKRRVVMLCTIQVPHVVLSGIFGADAIQQRHHSGFDSLWVNTRLHHEVPVEHVTHEVPSSVWRSALIEEVFGQELIPI
jgi:hypothetical protein